MLISYKNFQVSYPSIIITWDIRQKPYFKLNLLLYCIAIPGVHWAHEIRQSSQKTESDKLFEWASERIYFYCEKLHYAYHSWYLGSIFYWSLNRRYAKKAVYTHLKNDFKKDSRKTLEKFSKIFKNSKIEILHTGLEVTNSKQTLKIKENPVSYTHLTLPTKA